MGIRMKTMGDKCPFCSGQVNDYSASENWHQWKGMKHGVDFKISKLPLVEYYELNISSTIIIGDELDHSLISLELNYCPICGRKLSKNC